jgi:hypothetical protein
MEKILFPLIALASVLAVSNAQASWAYVPLELRMAGAKYIVVGKIDRIVDGIERNDRTYDVGAIKVSKVLKGPKTLKEVKLMWPGPARFALSTDIKFRKGQEGVWILYPDQKVKDVFWASFPSDYQALANLPKVQEKMKALNSIAWSKAVDGLQLGAIIEKYDVRKQKIVVKGRPVKALSRAMAYVVLRNTGKALTHAVNFPHDKQITLKLTGPDGKDMPLEMRVPAGRVPPLVGNHFLSVAPNSIRSVGYGVGLPMLVQSGKYSLELEYANKREGENFVKGKVWKGKLRAKATFNVK